MISKLAALDKSIAKYNCQNKLSISKYSNCGHYYIWGKRQLFNIEENLQKKIATLGDAKLILHNNFENGSFDRSGAVEEIYDIEMKKLVQILVLKWQEILKVEIFKVDIVKMNNRWGSSDPIQKKIALNLLLVRKPVECTEYVFLHELLHFFVSNHGPNFIDLFDTNMPNWRSIRKLLNNFPAAHADWRY